MLRVLICSGTQSASDWLEMMISHRPHVFAMDVMTDIDEALAGLSAKDYDVCLVGMNLASWFDRLSAQIQNRKVSEAKFVFGVTRITSETILMALKFKVNGIINLSNSFDDASDQLLAVVTGETDLARDNTLEEIHRLCGGKSPLRICRDDLDLRILAELMFGASNETIATTCNVAVQTVRNRLVRLMDEAGAKNRTQLATTLVRE